MNSIYGSITLDYEKIGDDKYKITDKKNSYIVEKVEEKNLSTTLDTSINQKLEQSSSSAVTEDKYECNCGYLGQMGLPCSHLVKILMRKKLEMMQYISDYWRVKKDYALWKEH